MANNIPPTTVISIRSTLPKRVAAHIFSWMCLALLVSASGVAFSVKYTSLFSGFIVERGGDVHLQPGGIIVLLLPFAFLLLKGLQVSNWSYNLLASLFMIFAFIGGVTLYFFMTLIGFDPFPMVWVFLSVAALFVCMVLIGTYTDKETSFIGLLLIMGTIGIVIIAVLRVVLHVVQVQLTTTIFIITIFTIVSALHMKQLRKVISEAENDNGVLARLALLGAFSIYIDFITVVAALILIAGKAGSKKDGEKTSNVWGLYSK